MLISFNFDLLRCFTRKNFIKKAAAIKILEYSPLGSEFEKQIDFALKQYQGLDKIYGFDKKMNHKRKNKAILKHK